MSLFRGLLKDKQPTFRTDNLGRLLLIALTNWQEVLVAGLRKAGFRSVRATHINLLRHIDMGGTRITDIAERAGITKQAVGQLVRACEKLKLVTTITDPNDRRARIVLFTNYGRSLILAQVTIFDEIDAELSSLLGPGQYKKLRENLAKIADWPVQSKKSN